MSVVFLASAEENRTWVYRNTSDYESHVANTVGIRRGENTHYVLCGSARKIARSAQVVVLGGWDSPAYWQIWTVARRRNIPTIGFYEGTGSSIRFKRGLVAKIRSRFYRGCTATLAVGRGSKAALSFMGVEDSRIFILQNSVDTDFFSSGEVERRVGGASGIRWLYVGQLISRKGIDLLIEAFAMRVENSKEDTLTIVGSGAEYGKLSYLSKRLGLNDSVSFVPHQSDRLELRRYYMSHDALVLPSRQEVFGLVVDEALAAGLYVIVSENAGIANELACVSGALTCEPTVSSITASMGECSALLKKLGHLGSRPRVTPSDQWAQFAQLLQAVTR